MTTKTLEPRFIHPPGPGHGPATREDMADRPVTVVTEVDTRYVDQDGDGVLDAVEVTEQTVAVGDDLRRVLSSRRILLSDIGDDGIPHRVSASG